MKFVTIAIALALIAAMSPFSSQRASAQTAPVALARIAPADESFGPLHLSVMGIRNSIALSGTRLDLAGLDGSDTFKNASLVEASIRDWEAQYPDDTWLPKMLLSLRRLYTKIPDSRAASRAVDVAAWLIARYPASEEANALRSELTAPAAVAASQ